MIQKIQKFGAAMLAPVLLFAFSGMIVGISVLFTNQQIFGSLAAEGTLWLQFWTIVNKGAWTVFNQMPLLFVVGLPIGLAKKEQETEKGETNMAEFLTGFSNILWGAPVLILLGIVGLLYGIRTKFFQIRKMGYILKNTAGEMFKKGGGASGNKGTRTPLQAVCWQARP